MIRKKTLCSVPGCVDHVREFNEKVCEQHFKKENKLCWVCEKNQADDNVHGVCIYCLAAQGNLIKEVQQEQEKKGKNNNKGPISQNLNIARGPANIGAPPNMGMADNMGIDLESIPDLPQMVPRINQFNPPTAYEGFANRKQNYQGAAGNADYHDADNRKEQEKIRKKTLCSVPGCVDPVRGINEKVCEQHFKKENKLCWACEKNQADDNVHGVCIYCLATQGNLIKEVQQEQEKKGKNNNKGPISQNLNIARGPANIGEHSNVSYNNKQEQPQLQKIPQRQFANNFNMGKVCQHFILKIKHVNIGIIIIAIWNIQFEKY